MFVVRVIAFQELQFYLRIERSTAITSKKEIDRYLVEIDAYTKERN